MIRYIGINPDGQHGGYIWELHASTFDRAKKMVGLNPLEVDHGLIYRARAGFGWEIVVDEFGLFKPDMAYFSLGTRLYAGRALVYAFDSKGDTEDTPSLAFMAKALPIAYYKTADEVEAAIRSGKIERPQFKIGRKLMWTWPGPRPTKEAMDQAFQEEMPSKRVPR